MTRVCFQTYSLFEGDNPVQCLDEFRSSERAQWLSERGVRFEWHTRNDVASWTTIMSIYGYLTEDQYLEWILRWR